MKMSNQIKLYILLYKLSFGFFIMLFSSVKSQTVDVVNPMDGYDINESNNCTNSNQLSSNFDDVDYSCAFSEVMYRIVNEIGYNPCRVAHHVNVTDLTNECNSDDAEIFNGGGSYSCLKELSNYWSENDMNGMFPNFYNDKWHKINTILNGNYTYEGSTCSNCNISLTLNGHTMKFKDDGVNDIHFKGVFSKCRDNYIPYYEEMWGYNGVDIYKSTFTSLPSSDGTTSLYDSGDDEILLQEAYDYEDIYDYPMATHGNEYKCARPMFEYNPYDFIEDGIDISEIKGEINKDFEGKYYTGSGFQDTYNTTDFWCKSQTHPLAEETHYDQETEDPIFKCYFNDDGNYVTRNAWGTNEYPCVIYGCTDTTASNYYPNAHLDDTDESLCTYEGCTDPDAKNYNPDATPTVKIPIFESVSYGNGNSAGQWAILHSEYDIANDLMDVCTYSVCNNTDADNFYQIYDEDHEDIEDDPEFNPENYYDAGNKDVATDGYCLFNGCMDPFGTDNVTPNYNYNSEATSDYENDCKPQELGCIEQESIYYDEDKYPLANTDDGTCYKPIEALVFEVEYVADYQIIETTTEAEIETTTEAEIETTTEAVIKVSWPSLFGMANAHEIVIEMINTLDGSLTTEIVSNIESYNDEYYKYDSSTNQQYYIFDKGWQSCEPVKVTITVKTPPSHDSEFYTYVSDSKYATPESISDNTWISDPSIVDNYTQVKELTATKGNHENRIELLWSNNNNTSISFFEIERRVLTNEDNTNWTVIGQVNNEIHHYIDYNADANVIYEYRINALIRVCEDSSSSNSEDQYGNNYSNITPGFRIPYSNVYGQVTYDNGSSAVEGANLIAIQNEDESNYSLKFEGEINHKLIENSQSNFSMMAWIKLEDSSSNYNFLTNSAGSEYIQINQGVFNSNLTDNVLKSSSGINLNESWNHLAITYNDISESLTTYINGVKNDVFEGNFSDFSSFYIKTFNGNLDEISLWNSVLSDEFISENYNKYLKRTNEGIIAYYKCNEQVGSDIYDSSISNLGVLNENHIPLHSSVSFDPDCPSVDQITYSAISNQNGYFTIEELSYPNSGAIFEVTPVIPAVFQAEIIVEPAHIFEPSYQSIYLSEGDNVANINFSDVSSVIVSGTVFYIDPNKTCNEIYANACFESTNIDNFFPEYDNETEVLTIDSSTGTQIVGAQGVAVLIDGDYAFSSTGDTILTDDGGAFELSVPLGLHQLSLFKDGHTFVNDIWQTANHVSLLNENNELMYVYNFNENKSNIHLYDNTKRKLLGRVCGGLTEGYKDPFDASSVANIGQAFFGLTTNGHSMSIQTDDKTGNYEVNLLPLEYEINGSDGTTDAARVIYIDDGSGNIKNNDYAIGLTSNAVNYRIDMTKQGNNELIIPVESSTDDSDDDSDDDSEEFDILLYDNVFNIIYRSIPSISIYTSKISSDSLEIIGESQFVYLEENWDSSGQVWNNNLDTVSLFDIDNESYTFNDNPVFLKDKSYVIHTMVSENYETIISDQYYEQELITYKDTVKFGSLSLNDGRNSNSYSIDSTYTNILFEAKEINTSLNETSSFEKSFTITYSNDFHSITHDESFYVFGTQVDEGLSFFTTGPEVVEMVLRDPPGDNSYSYIESGSSSLNSVEILSPGDQEITIKQKQLNLGSTFNFTLPFGGPMINTELVANTELDLTFTSEIDETSISTYESFNGETFRTSSEEYNIGSGGDLYIANNYNMVYGTNKNLEIVKVSECELQGYVCFGETSSYADSAGVSVGVETLYTSYENEVEDDLDATAYTIGRYVGLEIVPVGFKTKTVYDQNHILNNLVPTLEWIRNTYFGMSDIYVRVDSNCYDNETHPSYNKNTNPYPCYTYNEVADNSDPFELPFNVFEDIEIRDYIPSGFVSLVENALMNSQSDATFSGISQSTLDAMEEIVQISEESSGVLSSLSDIAGNSFWEDFATLIGSQNLLLSIQTFKEQVIDEYAGTLEEFEGGLGMLISVLENMTYTPPTDKIKFYNDQIKLWKAAVEANEQDKSSIFDDSGSQSEFIPELLYTETYGPSQNYSLSAGNAIENIYRTTEIETTINTIEFSINGTVLYEIGGYINGFGTVYNDVIPIVFETKKTTNNTELSYMGFGYELSDNDESDFISIDVKESNNGWGPIFRKRAGQTMCPHEDEEQFLFYDYNSDNNVFAPATQPREVPGIDINPKSIVSVPESEAAVFNLSLTNESAAMEDMVYTIMVDEASNSHGAILKIDGESVARDIMVPYGQTINKVLTVEKGPEEIEYTASDSLDNRLGIIIRSQCQYSYGTSNTNDIADTVYFEVSFIRECTDIEITAPFSNWVYNSKSDGVDIDLSGYDWNFYSLQSLNIKRKMSFQDDALFRNIHVFQKVDDEDDENNCNDCDTSYLFSNSGYSSFKDLFDSFDDVDGPYDIVAESTCGFDADGNPVKSYSEISSGYKDTKLPEPFGSPQPSDGILSVDDEIQINWSELIDESHFYNNPTLTSINAIKNLTEITHDAYIYIDDEGYLEIPYGLNIQNKSFTVEMWINPEKAEGNLFEQGYDNNRLTMFINDNKTLGVKYETNNGDIISNSISSIPLANDSISAWQHIAFVYDYDQSTISFIRDGSLVNTLDVQSFNCDYNGEGPITIGNNGFEGAIHELRVWSTNKSSTSIYQSLATTLSGSESNLLGYWPMNELSGFPLDRSRSRHISGDVNWAVDKKGFGYDFNGNQVLNTPIGTIVYDTSDDFTMEFWFKSESTNESLISNGSYISEGDNTNTWTIGIDSNGHISIHHNINDNSTLLMSSSDVFDDNAWHHLALVKNAKSTTTLYVDQIEQASCSSNITAGFAGSQLTFGAKQYRNSTDFEYSEKFNGKIDEFRLWHMKRTVDQLYRYQNIRLDGTEIGLDLYFPFEHYNNGELLSSNTFNSDTLSISESTFTYESTDLPLIRMNNPYEAISFESILNQDRIIYNITEEIKDIEGVIVDISVGYSDQGTGASSGVYDLRGNMANPVSWSCYIDKNQLVWSESNIELEKLLGENLFFETDIINKGGSIESYEISELPSWLTVSSTYGIIEPNSSLTLEFEVDQSLFIGDYEEQILLTGNNNFSEVLHLDINVESNQPQFNISVESFQYNMNFIGKILVDGVSSRDGRDILIAYVGDEVRGYTSPMYFDEYDSYIVFLTVFSNQLNQEEITFRLWDASEGKIQSKVDINSQEASSLVSVEFVDGQILGDFDNLVSFEADNTLRQEIELSNGWNWISLNLEFDQEPTGEVLIDTVMSSVNLSNIQVLKGIDEFSQYSSEFGWIGSMNNKMSLAKMYKLKIDQNDTIIYEGKPVDLSNSDYEIDIKSGWNWIGYLGQRTLEINTALSSLNSSQGDIIKSQSSFSMYASESIGWLGTLNSLSEGQGYMLNSSEEQLLIYPQSSLYGANNLRINDNNYTNNHWQVDNSAYETSMNIVARINHPKYNFPNQNNILGAFNESNCNGSVNLTLIDDENSLYFLTVYGNHHDNLTFKYFDDSKDKAYVSNNSIYFESNKILGSIDNPYNIEIDTELQDLEDYMMINIYPNPFEDLFELEFFVNENSDVEIDLFDISGRKIHTLKESSSMIGHQQLEFNCANIEKGIYIISLKIDNNQYQKRLIKN